MPKLDPFSAQIVELVRNMPDDAILALVREKLGAAEPPAAAAVATPAPRARKRAARAKSTRVKTPKARAAKAPAKPQTVAAPKAVAKPAPKAVAKPAPKAVAKPAPKAVANPAPKAAASAKRAASGEKRVTPQRQKVLSAVERAVKGSKGLSASEVARATGIGQVRVATALRELKHAKRIFQGGDRRFARYAADQRMADQASVTARRTASGPILKKRPAKG